MNLQIRFAKSEEFESILELQEKSLRTLSSGYYDDKQIESLVKSQKSCRLNADEIILLACSNSHLVGFAALDKRDPIINAVFVHPDSIRQGVGTQLLEALEYQAIQKGHNTLHVMSSLTAVSFYGVNGYHEIKKTGFYPEEAVWIACLDMEKKLTVPWANEEWNHRFTLILFILFIVILILLNLTK